MENGINPSDPRILESSNPQASGEFEDGVLQPLRGLLRRLRLYVVAEGLAYASAVLFACFVFQIGVDYLFRLPVDMRAALLVVIGVILAATLWRKMISPLRRRVDVEDAASVLEQHFPHLGSRLISAVQFARGRAGPPEFNSPALVDQVIRQAGGVIRPLELRGVLNHKRARLHSLTVCAVLAAWVMLTLLADQTMGTWFERNVLLGEADWRQDTYLTVLNDEDRDGVIYAPRGDDLTIRVRVDGHRPRQVEIELHFASGKQESRLMTAVGQDEFRFTIPGLGEALVLWVRGGDAQSDGMRVRVVERPRITSATVTIYPPAYALEAPYQLRSAATLIEVLTGGEVHLRFGANKPLSRALLLRDGEPAGEAVPAGEGYVARFKPGGDAAWSFALTDETGLTNARPRRFNVRLGADAPPTVSLVAEGVGDLITSDAVLPLVITMKDRYGLAGGALVVQLDAATPDDRRIEIEGLTRAAKQFKTSLEFGVAELAAPLGAQLTLSAESRDLNDVTGPGVGTSAKYAFRIASAEELLAELRRREQEFRQEFERLIDMQESVRNDLLSAAGALRRGTAARQPLPGSAALERRQRQIGRQVGNVRSQFQRIHSELVINQMDSAEIRRRLVEGIVVPLDTLAARTLIQAADAVDALSLSPDAAQFQAVDRQQQALLEDMRRVLASMAKWEGYHETISLLQTIIKMQKELQSETGSALDEQLDDIFDDASEE